MDIAKIRKKIKDAERGEPGSSQKEPGPVPRETEGVSKTSEAKEATDAETGTGEESKGLPSVSDEAADATVELLTFNLSDEEYAFRISEIQEIVRVLSITRIPKTEPYLLGITSLRGKITPVIDLKKILSLKNESGGVKKKQKILILKGTKGPIGVLVDNVIGVVRTSSSTIVETPPHLPEEEMRFIEGVAIVDGRFISIIRTEETVNVRMEHLP
jgi:purine-binding chemotaxis protein CheW